MSATGLRHFFPELCIVLSPRKHFKIFQNKNRQQTLKQEPAASFPVYKRALLLIYAGFDPRRYYNGPASIPASRHLLPLLP